MRSAHFPLLASLAIGFAGCSADGEEPEPRLARASAELTPLPPRVCPTATPAISAWPPIDPVALLAGAPSDCTAGTSESPCAPHHVYTPAPSQTRQPLLLFLPGADMEPEEHDLVLTTGAATGYRTIGLSYDNLIKIDDACAGDELCEDDCAGLVRKEMLRGVDTTPHIDVARGDAIIPRLYRLLAHLDSIDPAGGWSSYYVPTGGLVQPDNIVWSEIIVAGFSVGAGEAMMISRLRQVHGLFVLDGPNETCEDGTGDAPALWMTAIADASAGRPRYGVRHDYGSGATTNTVSWQALGMGVSLFNLDCLTGGCASDVIDLIPPPTASVTDQLPPATCEPHGTIARDGCMPTDFGSGYPATAPGSYRLADAYALRLCYACDVFTCP